MKNNDAQTLKFKFDVSTYRLLGRELITDRITALFELVKNCYDANAKNVWIEFVNINPIGKDSKIIIKDDGLGMTFEDVRDKWMVIGTSSKRKNAKSPAPFNRNVAGKKGVGRFAVDKLGSILVLATKKIDTDSLLFLETDWSYYANEESTQLSLDFDNKSRLFTDIENQYWFEPSAIDTQGTTLEISSLNDIWSENDIKRAIKELSKIIRPNFVQKYPFNVFITATEYNIIKKPVESLSIEHATIKVDLSYDINSQTQEILAVENGKLTNKKVPIRGCGPVGLTLYYYDKSAKAKFKKLVEEKIDGIKIYRDGLIATPFAEYADHIDEQKDLFGIDKRRWSGFFDKISTRDMLGWVDISEAHNSGIIDATNRQDFVDNQHWRDLKSFVIEQIQKVEEFLKIERKIERERFRSDYNDVSTDIGNIQQEINLLIDSVDSDDQKKQLEKLSKQLKKTQVSAKKGIAEYNKLEKEKQRQEDLLFSLVSLQTFASMLSHITRTSLGRIKRQVEYISKWLSGGEKQDNCVKFSKNVFKEMTSLDKAVDFMLKYAKDDQNFSDININDTISNLFNNIYAPEFDKQAIKVIFDSNENLSIRYNSKAFEDIFDNLISNSIKALHGLDDKQIKCSVYVDKQNLVIYFSDNGCGINEDNKYRVFDVFYTTTAEQGGAGLGMYIVKTRLESIQGSIEIVDSEYKDCGTTFKIILPFKK